MINEDILDDLQADIVGRLSADEYFATINVFPSTHKALDGDITKHLGPFIAKATKRGMAVVVEDVSANDDLPNVQAGPLAVTIPISILEWRPTNRDTTIGGTGKTSLAVCRRILRVLKHYRPSPLSQSLVPLKPTIRPASTDSVFMEHHMIFGAQEADIVAEQKVSEVRISRVGTPLTLVMSTVTVGCAVYYTTDGTHPWIGNAAATLYLSPVTPTTGQTFRAAAYKAGLIASNVTDLTV